MQITLTRNAYNTIVKACKSVAKSAQDGRAYTSLHCDGKNVAAMTFTESTALEVSVPCEQPSDDCCIPVPIQTMRTADKDEPIINLSYDGKTLRLQFGMCEKTYEILPNARHEWHVEHFMPRRDDRIRTVSLNPKDLCNAIAAAKVTDSDRVEISIHKAWQCGMVIETDKAKALLLPIRHRDNF